MTQHRSLARVTSHIINRPLCVTERHASLILSVLRSELNIDIIHQVEGPSLDRAAMHMIQQQGKEAAEARVEDRGRREQEYKTFAEQNGIAIIPVHGTLMKNWGLDPFSGSTGYDGIKTKLIDAYDDDDIEAIYLDIDSPGGVVSGLFDLCDLIYAMSARNGGKPIWALANEQACSAAMAIGSSADQLHLTRTAEIGSVGVVWLYTNIKEAMKQDGVHIRVFRAGKHKFEGNPFEDLPDEAATRIQGELDDIREIFVECVARGRGLTKKAVRDTEALTYMGVRAREIGFATSVQSEDQVWTAMVEAFGR